MPDPHRPTTDLDLRLVRNFIEVAEHEQFGRAAEVLHLAQPSLSRQIQRLEHQLEARLLDRTPHGTTLTPAGEVFLLHAKDLLRASAAAAAAVRDAVSPTGIVIGHIRSLVITPAVRGLRQRYPDADVRTLHVHWSEPHRALLERRVDVVVARLPFPTDRLRVTALYDEPRVVVVATDHRLAGRAGVTLADIAEDPIPTLPFPEWDAFWRVDPRPDGRPAPTGPPVDDVEDMLEMAAGGRTVCIAPVGLGSVEARHGVTTVPLHDVDPGQVVLASRANDRSELVAAFRRQAMALLTGPEPDAP